jgi:hypothetical protein
MERLDELERAEQATLTGDMHWVARSRQNHMLDAESLAYAAAYMLAVQRLSDEAVASGIASLERAEKEAAASASPRPPEPRRDGWLGERVQRGSWVTGDRPRGGDISKLRPISRRAASQKSRLGSTWEAGDARGRQD